MSAIMLVKKYRDARRDSEKKMDTQYQRNMYEGIHF